MTRNNGELLDPRQAKCLELYSNPASATFGNLKQSALKSGFGKEYARNLTQVNPKWLTDNLKQDITNIKRAETNITKALHLEPEQEPDPKKAIELLKIQQRATEFVLKTLARTKYKETQDNVIPSVVINITKYNDDDVKGRVIEVEPEQ